MNALAELETLRLKQVKGELMQRKVVTATVVMLMTMTKNHMLAIPQRLARRLIGLSDYQTAYDLLDTEIRAGQREISEFSIDDFVAYVTRNAKTAAAETQPSANGDSESAETL